MAKTVYFTNVAATTHRGNNDTKLAGATSWWQPLTLSEARGSGAATMTAASIAGTTVGIEFVTGSLAYEFISEPLSADFTIAGTITGNMWAAESTMNDNTAINFVVDKIDGATGAISQIAKSARVTEMAITTPAVNNFTVTPTSTACKRGDRIRIRPFIDDIGTAMIVGTSTFSYNGTTAAANGDSYITFTENLTFETAGDPGILEQPTRTTGVAVGINATRTRYAQSFVATSDSLTSLSLWLRKQGSPTDNLIIELQTSSGGNPSGTVLATVATIAGSSLTITATLTNFSGPWTLTPGATYWIVLSRSGALDLSNYYYPSVHDVDTGWVAKQFDGSAWTLGVYWLTVALAFPVSTYYLTDTAAALGGVPTLVSDFTGADENPLSEGGNWANLNTSGNPLKRISNAVSSGSAAFGTSYWTPTNFGPDLEAYVTFTVKGGGGDGIVIRVQGEGGAATWDGYRFNVTTTDVSINRILNGGQTVLIAVNQSWANGDKLGVRAVGSLLQAWRQASGSSVWNLVASVVDTTYLAAGKVGVQAGDATCRLDDFYVATNSNLFTQKATTTRGAGSTSVVASTATGPTAGLLVQEWYTPEVVAFTLGGKAKFNIRALESDAAANASMKTEIAVCATNGSGAVVWGVANIEPLATAGELGTTDAAYIAWVAGDDVAVTTGQRLRFRVYADDSATGPMVFAAGYSVTVSYNGTTASAAGDTYVILPVAVTENASGPATLNPNFIGQQVTNQAAMRAAVV